MMASKIDWTMPIEAISKDGSVCAARAICHDGMTPGFPHVVQVEGYGPGAFGYGDDGSVSLGHMGPPIRNVAPPMEVHACRIWVRRNRNGELIADVTEIDEGPYGLGEGKYVVGALLQWEEPA